MLEQVTVSNAHDATVLMNLDRIGFIDDLVVSLIVRVPVRVSTAELDIVQDGCGHWQVTQSRASAMRKPPLAGNIRQREVRAIESQALEWMSINLVSSALRRLESQKESQALA